MYKYWHYRYRLKGSSHSWEQDVHYGTECDLHNYVTRSNKINSSYVFEALPNARTEISEDDNYENSDDDYDDNEEEFPF